MRATIRALNHIAGPAELSLTLQILQHLPKRHQSLAAAFFDVQGLEETAAELALHFLDSAGGDAVERDGAAGAAVVAAGPPQLAHHLTQHLSRTGAALRRPRRQDQLILKDP